MRCCVECFHDPAIKSRIRHLRKIGHCSFCEAEDVYVYDTEIDSELTDDFEALLDTYKAETVLPDGYPESELRLLKDELAVNWTIFSLPPDKIDVLIRHICKNKFMEDPELFERRIGIIQRLDQEYMDRYSLLGEYNWEDFVSSIKTQNRFHSKQLNTSVLYEFLDHLKKLYKRGTLFYRARISGATVFPLTQMGSPPAGLASAGRVNPEGISYLYLGNDRTTTLNEVRAGLHDYVSIAAFELKEDISVVDLTGLDRISPFSGLNFTLHAINKANLIKMSNEIAKPLRRQDSPLDYLPTQYICEFIKTITFKDGSACCGIEYKSTMNKGGYNLAAFSGELFECVEVKVHDVQELHYSVEPVIPG
ncbi:RES domain-containing protein [Cohnella fermenti]|uniref:RES domain-containing protein n=1 Tax=Cohnella fermenti TaxID=2565925 RepID=A0A4S4C4K1_9BACL|nr:RES domain-containing protein [Cohnella fermenti]THF82659.1 RES domain-containing protein [Cohnella fermenti]